MQRYSHKLARADRTPCPYSQYGRKAKFTVLFPANISNDTVGLTLELLPFAHGKYILIIFQGRLDITVSSSVFWII